MQLWNPRWAGGRVCSAVLAGPGGDAEIFGGGGMHILAKKFILIK